nr:VCBS repeat-containing protein [Acanthopleuribacter pedis]
MFAYFPGNGTLWAGWRENKTTKVNNWGRIEPAAGRQFAVGQFDGEGGDDLVGLHPSDGTLWLGRNTGSAFEFTPWSSLNPATGWTIAAGNLNGDGLDDVFAYFSGTGTVWYGHNAGHTLNFHGWGSLPTGHDWQFDIAQFVASDRDDFVAYNPTDGNLWVGTNTGNGFAATQWASVTPFAGWDFAAGNFDGQGPHELVGYHPSNGTVWYGRNTGSAFNFTRWGDVLEPQSGWSFQSGVFHCDGDRDELFGYERGEGGLWVGSLNREAAEGYAWPLSAAPGETIQFYASGEGLPTVDILRYASGETLMTTLEYTPVAQTTNARPWRYGAGWSPSFSPTIPDNWPSGMYAARFRGDTGCQRFATFVVKPRPEQKSRVAVLANVATWLAYNTWGGRGKYHGAALVSYLRPNPSTAPVGENGQTHHLARAERWLLGWLEDEGFQLDLYTDIDYHDGLVQVYDTLVIGTHPEYWSPEMITRLRQFLDAGGSLVYLGGNGLFASGLGIGEHAFDGPIQKRKTGKRFFHRLQVRAVLVFKIPLLYQLGGDAANGGLVTGFVQEMQAMGVAEKGTNFGLGEKTGRGKHHHLDMREVLPNPLNGFNPVAFGGHEDIDKSHGDRGAGGFQLGNALVGVVAVVGLVKVKYGGNVRLIDGERGRITRPE